MKRVPLPILGLTAVLLAVLGLRFFAGEPASAEEHPAPRKGITAEAVMPSDRYAGYPMIQQAYAEAAQIPGVLDGLYCYCDCSEHSGHRSLLTCFESDHSAGCDICMRSAMLAYDMDGQGRSLREIRRAVDEAFGHSH